MYRFFVFKKDNQYFDLTKEALQHIKVLRIEQKEFLCNYEQEFYLCTLEGTRALIKDKLIYNHEYEGNLTLAMAYINIKNFELVIQKAVELGVKTFIPMISQYCEYKKDSINNKKQRWESIALGAAEQSFRNQIMKIENFMSFEEVIQLEYQNKIIAHEKIDSSQYLTQNFIPSNSLILIGPEGGFSDKEIELANQHNFKVISLGKTILRAETAALKALSLVKDK